jgi:hypothetical protein
VQRGVALSVSRPRCAHHFCGRPSLSLSQALVVVPTDVKSASMQRAKQKPNAACACGSGRKYKKCCALGAFSAAARSLYEEMNAAERLIDDAVQADHQAGDTPHALRLATAALHAAGEVMASCAADTPGAATLLQLCECSEEGGVQQVGEPKGPLESAVELVLVALEHVLQAQLQLGNFAAAEDTHARACAILDPPHTFWARGVHTLSHAAWRDQPLPVRGRVAVAVSDVRAALTPDVARRMRKEMLRRVRAAAGRLACLAGRPREGAAHFASALGALLQLEPAGPERSSAEARLQQDLGNAWWQARDGARARASYAAALVALDAGADAADESVRARRALVQDALAAVATKVGVSVGPDLVLPQLESAWEKAVKARRDGGGGDADAEDAWHGASGAPVQLCAVMLAGAESAAAQAATLRRAAALGCVAAAARRAARRACRACAAPPPPAGAPLKPCGACKRVAYCNAACQAADWRRHQRCCADAGAEGVLADATCIACAQPLLPADDAAAAAAAAAAAGGGDDSSRVALLRCCHLAHARCVPLAADVRRSCSACVSEGGAR